MKCLHQGGPSHLVPCAPLICRLLTGRCRLFGVQATLQVTATTATLQATTIMQQAARQLQPPLQFRRQQTLQFPQQPCNRRWPRQTACPSRQSRHPRQHQSRCERGLWAPGGWADLSCRLVLDPALFLASHNMRRPLPPFPLQLERRKPVVPMLRGAKLAVVAPPPPGSLRLAAAAAAAGSAPPAAKQLPAVPPAAAVGNSTAGAAPAAAGKSGAKPLFLPPTVRCVGS